MLNDDALESILAAMPGLGVAVLGDLFLDRYLDIDPALTEPSVETGLDAYQVVAIRSSPGAAGTVINNLVALGVEVSIISVIGDDGEGLELQRALSRMPTAFRFGLVVHKDRRTPTYTKPMLAGRELNRLDIKNRSVLPSDAEEAVLHYVEMLWRHIDALVIVDQVTEPDCGVVTSAVRRRVAELAQADPAKIVTADSRQRIGLFRSVRLKPNQRECLAAIKGASDVTAAARTLAARCGRTVFCTLGEGGILVAEPQGEAPTVVPAYPVQGPIDPVGAGDSTSAAIACALASGASSTTAAAFGNLVASITVQQIGTTGTATPQQIRQAMASRLLD